MEKKYTAYFGAGGAGLEIIAKTPQLSRIFFWIIMSKYGDSSFLEGKC